MHVLNYTGVKRETKDAITGQCPVSSGLQRRVRQQHSSESHRLGPYCWAVCKVHRSSCFDISEYRNLSQLFFEHIPGGCVLGERGGGHWILKCLELAHAFPEHTIDLNAPMITPGG